MAPRPFPSFLPAFVSLPSISFPHLFPSELGNSSLSSARSNAALFLYILSPVMFRLSTQSDFHFTQMASECIPPPLLVPSTLHPALPPYTIHEFSYHRKRAMELNPIPVLSALRRGGGVSFLRGLCFLQISGRETFYPQEKKIKKKLIYYHKCVRYQWP